MDSRNSTVSKGACLVYNDLCSVPSTTGYDQTQFPTLIPKIAWIPRDVTQ